MNNPEVIELKNLDPDDISEVIAKVEKSFDLKFDTNTFRNTKTFGDLCDTIYSLVELEHSEECTSQQAFYKIRQAIADVQLIEKNSIIPNSRLEQLFPKNNRKTKIKRIEKELGFSLKILNPKDWIITTLAFIFIGSLIELFVNWKFGLAGFAFSIFCFRAAEWTGKEFSVKTVGEAAAKMARENYIKSRRNLETVNRKEIVEKIKELFIRELDLDPAALTRDAIFA